MTPNARLFLALCGVFFVLAAAYRTRCVSRPLAPGRLVQIDAGDHRGLCGWIEELTVDAGSGREGVRIRLNDGNDGRWVEAERADVSPLFG